MFLIKSYQSNRYTQVILINGSDEQNINFSLNRPQI